MDNNIIDNRCDDTQLVDSIRDLLKDTKKGKFATGYFYLDGYNLVKKDLQDIESLQIIMGDETTRPTKREISRGYDDRENKIQYVKENLMHDIAHIFNEEQQEKIIELYELISEGRIDVRIYNKGKFHPKLYIFLSENKKTAIVGSSNFTKPGLKENVELNIIEKESTVVNDLVDWFDELWNNETEPFKEELIKIIETSGILEKDLMRWGHYLPPKELFKILAFELLDGRIDLVKEKKILTLFQEIGVLNAESKIKKYYGCLIADSVGLGKSFIGAEIIKDLFYGKVDFWDGTLNEKWDEHPKAALLIVPAHLKKQWRDDVILRHFFTNCIINPIDGDFFFKLVDKSRGHIGDIRIISYSKFTRLEKDSLRRLSDEFDIILIDEAHRFRNDDTKAWNNVQFLKKKISYEIETGHGVPEGIRNRFILLSATPLNNRISDLLNLFRIFLDRDLRDLSRQGKNIKLFGSYNKIKKELRDAPNNSTLKRKLTGIVRKIKDEILDDLMILRTRMYIRDSPLYKGTKINGKPLIFKDPKVKRIEYDKNLSRYYDAYIELYNGLASFLEELEYPYIDLFLVEEKRKDNLRVLMKILLLKRMESSIRSFDISINRIKQKEEFLLSLLNKNYDVKRIRTEWQSKFGKKYDDEVDTDEEIGIYLGEEIDEVIEDEEKEGYLDVEILKQQTNKDIEIIQEYINKIEKVKDQKDASKYKDPKLERLKSIFNELIGNGGDTPKIILFTQFKDTANYVYDEINEWIDSQSRPQFCRIKTDIVTGDVDIDTKEKCMQRFAPIANDYKLKEDEEIHILFSTDALSEGVNLQDASIVIDYDLPWNPMRIVQRVGRVNRIGSEKDIWLYNFFPDKDLDQLLKLLSKLWKKIDDVKTLLAKEMQILSDEEEVTVDTIGEKIRDIREETDISQLEMNYRSDDFRDADVYGEDPETIQKMRIISKLMELGIPEGEFAELKTLLENIPYYTILENEELTKVFRVIDKVRNEKMKNFVIVEDDDSCIEGNIDSILKLADMPEGKHLIDMDPEELQRIRERISKLDTHFENEVFNKYTSVFTPLRQGHIVDIKGLQRKVVKYMRSLTTQRSLIPIDEDERENRLRIRQIYESMKLRTQEVAKLKEWFQKEGIDLQRDDLKKQPVEKIFKVLDDYYNDYLAKEPDTYFGGIRTDKDLDYESIGWYA